ncbi:DUF6263 family protein [Schlesneria paludicola]|uniref:DUF6263 family protein n=1 Tax=Schlesneria paludicola TaxID=360056 RepID=UPI00029A685D|nr:DUF6263 family protein [Schlesneria paludicola]
MWVKNSWWKLGLIVITLGFGQWTHADPPTYQLVYRFQPGQFTHYEIDDRAEMIVQHGNNFSKIIQQTQWLKSYRVVTVDENGGATLEPITEAVRMSSQAGEKPVLSYDSEKDSSPPKEFENVAGTIGRPLARFQVAPSGRLLKVSMIATDVPKSFSDAAEKADPAINFLIVLPEKPVKIGEQWTEKYETPVPVGNGLTRAVTMIRTYELTKVNENIATISMRTSLLTPLTEPEILRNLVQQTPSGTIEFDLAKGRISNRSLQINEKVVGAYGSQTLLEARGESVEKMVQHR